MSLIGIGGAGISLPPPQALYPAQINFNPSPTATNEITLPAGSYFLIPSGRFGVDTGAYTWIQILDPVSNTWEIFGTTSNDIYTEVNSDGTNFRVVNFTGCPIAALITSSGAGFTTAPAVTPSAGASTWAAILGGAVGTVSVRASSSGSGYTYTPIVNIAAPAPGGIQATAVAVLSGSVVQSVTITNQGAGYASPPTAIVIPNPWDPAIGSITNASLSCSLSGSGSVTSLICTNPGTPLTSVPTLAFSGTSTTGAAATVIMCFTLTSFSVTAAGSGYSGSAEVVTYGGVVAGTAAWTNPFTQAGIFIPRAAHVTATVSNGGISGTGQTIIDGGLYQAVPSAYALPGPAGTASTLGQFTVNVGGVSDTVFLTPL